MSCMGGATAPLSSSSSESALGLFSDLMMVWFSRCPMPSPPVSGSLPVISSTAASTALKNTDTETDQTEERSTFNLEFCLSEKNTCNRSQTVTTKKKKKSTFLGTIWFSLKQSSLLSGSMHPLKVSMSSSTWTKGPYNQKQSQVW